MRFLVVGCSYRTAQLALRERLAIPADRIAAALDALVQLPDVLEGMILSTCNRVEVYAVVTHPAHAERPIRELLARSSGVDLAQLEPVLYSYSDDEAVAHIFRVSSSLDSMVIGEAQIAGQVKGAYSAGCAARTVGPLLNRCMHRAFAAAKRVRSETQVARHPVSVSSVAVDLAGRVFGDLTQSAVLVIGAGEMAELALQHLIGAGVAQIDIVNRTYERAVQLAFQVGARAHRFETLTGRLLLADIIISSTRSTEPVLTRKLLGSVMRQRKQRPLFIVDIAVPPDVEGAAAGLANVYLFNVDDLEQVVAENLKERRKEARVAERLIREEVEHFLDWLRRQEAVPVIKDLRRHFTEVALGEAARTAIALHLEQGEDREKLDAMARAIVNKLLHNPTQELKEQASRPDGGLLARSTQRLFKLAPAPAGADAPEVPQVPEAPPKKLREESE